MNQRSLALLYPAAALGLAALLYAAYRIGSLRADLEVQGRRLHDVEQYLRPLRDYAKNRIEPP
jgi:hypothetical protein